MINFLSLYLFVFIVVHALSHTEEPQQNVFVCNDRMTYDILKTNLSDTCANATPIAGNIIQAVNQGDTISKELKEIIITVVDIKQSRNNNIIVGRDCDGEAITLYIPKRIENPGLRKGSKYRLLALPLDREFRHKGDRLPKEPHLYRKYNYHYLCVEGDTVGTRDVIWEDRDFLYVGDPIPSPTEIGYPKDVMTNTVSLTVDTTIEDNCNNSESLIIRIRLTNNSDIRYLSFIYDAKSDSFPGTDYFTLLTRDNGESSKIADSREGIESYVECAQRITDGNMILEPHGSVEYIFVATKPKRSKEAVLDYLWRPELSCETVRIDFQNCEAAVNELLNHLYLCPEDEIVNYYSRHREPVVSIKTSALVDSDSKSYVTVLSPEEKF